MWCSDGASFDLSGGGKFVIADPDNIMAANPTKPILLVKTSVDNADQIFVQVSDDLHSNITINVSGTLPVIRKFGYISSVTGSNGEKYIQYAASSDDEPVDSDDYALYSFIG